MNRYTILHNGEDTHIVVIATNEIRAKEKLDAWLKNVGDIQLIPESKICKVSGCTKDVKSKYMCKEHYYQFK